MGGRGIEYDVFAVQVHGSAVGKYCSALSGFLTLNSSSFLTNVGQVLHQLACLPELQEEHFFVCGDGHSLVLCFSAQLPHLSSFSRHSLAKWPQP